MTEQIASIKLETKNILQPPTYTILTCGQKPEILGLNSQEICQGVSELINNYTLDPKTYGEMLPKTPEQIAATFEQGLATIAIDEQQKVIGHASLSPLIDYGKINIFEFGGWIVNKDHRHERINGLTLGEYIAQLTILNAASQDLTKVIGVIATVKRLNSLKGLKHIGMLPVNYQNYPFTTALTCVCKSSELHSGSECQQRRSELNTLDEKNISQKIPCTLMVHNSGIFQEIEKELTEIYLNQNNNPLAFDNIDLNLMLTLKKFYQPLGIEL